MPYLVYSGKVKGSLKIFSLLEIDLLGEKKSPREIFLPKILSQFCVQLFFFCHCSLQAEEENCVCVWSSSKPRGTW